MRITYHGPTPGIFHIAQQTTLAELQDWVARLVSNAVERQAIVRKIMAAYHNGLQTLQLNAHHGRPTTPNHRPAQQNRLGAG